MDEVLAASAGGAGLFVAGRAGAFSGGVAFQSSGGICPAGAFVFSITRAQCSAQRSPACIAALCGVASNARAARTDARCVANALRIRCGGRFAESLPSRPGIHAALRPRTLRRGSLRYVGCAAASRPDSNGAAGALTTDYFLPSSGAEVPAWSVPLLRPYKHQNEWLVL